jgi:hypothetical protein
MNCLGCLSDGYLNGYSSAVAPLTLLKVAPLSSFGALIASHYSGLRDCAGFGRVPTVIFSVSSFVFLMKVSLAALPGSS